jgi:hypothetical protein
MDLYSLQIVTVGAEAGNAQATWLQYLTALLTPLVAALGIWIAFNQWKTARMKLKLDLFDKRLAVYEVVQTAVRRAVVQKHFSEDMLAEYVQGIAGARWLYDREMKMALFDLFELLCRIQPYCELPDDASEEEQGILLSRESEAMEKIEEQWAALDARFAPFLTLGH